MNTKLLPFGLALAALNQANASVVYTQFGEDGFSSDPGRFSSGVSFNPMTGDVGEAFEVNPALNVGGCFGSMIVSGFNTLNTAFERTDMVVNSSDRVRFLTLGTMIDDDSSSWLEVIDSLNFEGATIADTIGDPGSYPFDGTPVYFGFRFQLDEMNADEFHYGYAQISGFYDADTEDSSFTVFEMAYNSTINEGIEVGAIPEPSAFILMTFAFGAGLMRRRR